LDAKGYQWKVHVAGESDMDVHRVHRTGSLLKGHMILPETSATHTFSRERQD